MSMVNLDYALVEQAKNEPAAFAELMLRYQDSVHNYLYRMIGNREDAADLTQEVFLRVYKALHRFREGAPFRPWMYKIATNVAINHLRARKQTVALEDEAPVRDEGISPDRAAELKELQHQVGGVLMTLPEAYRAVLLMRHIEELSYDEMAQALGVPLGTVKVRLHRARLQLMEKLRSNGIIDTDHELHSSKATTTPLP